MDNKNDYDYDKKQLHHLVSHFHRYKIPNLIEICRQIFPMRWSKLLNESRS
jgi:hypothetical protein